MGKLLWWLFGGFCTALEYLALGLVLCATLIGFPWGLQCFKMALVCLFPFQSKVASGSIGSGIFWLLFNIIWMCTGGFTIFLTHLCFGILCAITIIGMPFAKQHFKLARLAFSPFGKKIHTTI